MAAMRNHGPDFGSQVRLCVDFLLSCCAKLIEMLIAYSGNYILELAGACGVGTSRRARDKCIPPKLFLSDKFCTDTAVIV